jgi:hypothetical protein
MAMNSRAVLLVAIVAVGILVSRAAAADPAAAGPTVDELRRGVAAQEAALRSFKLSCHIDTLVSYNGKNIAFVASEDVEIIGDLDGRIRYESSGTIEKDSGTPGVTRTEKVLGVFNGKEARNLRTLNEVGRVGVIDRVRTAAGCRTDFLEFFATYHHEPVSACLNRPNLVRLDDDTWDGRPVQVVETSFDTPPGKSKSYKYRLWIDPARGFAVVKRASLVRETVDDKWEEYYRVEGHDYKEFGGFWLPMRAVAQLLHVGEKDIRPGAKLSDHRIEVRQWEVNPAVDDAMFTFDFPQGLGITDRTLPGR